LPYLLVQSDGDLRIKFTVGLPNDTSSTVQIVQLPEPTDTISDSIVNNATTENTTSEDGSSD